MKHSLILLCLLCVIACKNINQASKDPKMTFQNTAYLHLPHPDNQSVLRRKLLNLSLTKKLNQKDEVKIETGDEFKFLNDQHILGENEKVDYENYKSTCALVLVSFKDHLEFFFVPTGISRDTALSQLGIVAESGEKLFWAVETPSNLTKGHTYYLLSASTSEIKNNDVNFYDQSENLKDFKGSTFKFKNNQKITLDFKIDYFTKQTTVVAKDGNTRRFNCTRDMREAGGCDGCEFKIETVTGALIKTEWKNNDFKMFFKLNGVEYSMTNLDSTIPNGHLQVVLDLKQMNLAEDVSLEISPVNAQQKTGTFRGFDYTGNCASTNDVAVQDLTPVIHADLNVDVKGRALSI